MGFVLGASGNILFGFWRYLKGCWVGFWGIGYIVWAIGLFLRVMRVLVRWALFLGWLGRGCGGGCFLLGVKRGVNWVVCCIFACQTVLG